MIQVELPEYNICFSNKSPFVLIAGPCQLESRAHAIHMVESIKEITSKLGIPFIFKSSFDKANRTSLEGRRGVGITNAIAIFNEIKEKLNCPILTDVHKESDIEVIQHFVDILQIPAFLCRQTDLLEKAAKSGKVINIKKGQFLAPQDVKNIVKKLEHFGSKKILLTERGATFGYNNLVVDMRSFPIMKETGYPVIIDATHSTQQPGGLGGASGGDRKYAPILANAALTSKISAVFAEVHNNPDEAPSDGPCMMRLSDLERYLVQMKEIDDLVKYNLSFSDV